MVNNNIVPGEIHYAGFLVRLLAAFIDILILLPIFLVLIFIIFSDIPEFKDTNNYKSAKAERVLDIKEIATVTTENPSQKDSFLDAPKELEVEADDAAIKIESDSIEENHLDKQVKNNEKEQEDSLKAKQNIFDTIIWIIFILYSTYFLSSPAQATPGKQVMKIMVVSLENNGKITLYKAFERSLFLLISSLFFGAGFLIIAFTEEKTALHDLLCNTRVVYKKLY